MNKDEVILERALLFLWKKQLAKAGLQAEITIIKKEPPAKGGAA